MANNSVQQKDQTDTKDKSTVIYKDNKLNQTNEDSCLSNKAHSLIKNFRAYLNPFMNNLNKSSEIPKSTQNVNKISLFTFKNLKEK